MKALARLGMLLYSFVAGVVAVGVFFALGLTHGSPVTAGSVPHYLVSLAAGLLWPLVLAWLVFGGLMGAAAPPVEAPAPPATLGDPFSADVLRLTRKGYQPEWKVEAKPDGTMWWKLLPSGEGYIRLPRQGETIIPLEA